MRGVGRLADVDAIAAVAGEATDGGTGAASATSAPCARARRSSAAKARTTRSPAVIIGIQKQPAVNTLELTERIDATLDDIQRALPQGMQIHRDLFRQADFIEQSLAQPVQGLRRRRRRWSSSSSSLFLMNIRAAAITLLALPLSLVAAVIAMDRFGLTLNSMSLGGLAIAIGELVDDAIIDVENVVRRLRENAARPGGGAPAGARGRLSREHRDPALGRLRDGHRRARVPAAVHARAASKAGCCGRSGSATSSRWSPRWSWR